MTLEEITTILEGFQADPNMVTKSMYSPTASDYPDQHLPFVEIHLAYLRKHQQVDPAQYLSNLRIMINQNKY